jgi:hypothetical protein
LINLRFHEPLERCKPHDNGFSIGVRLIEASERGDDFLEIMTTKWSFLKLPQNNRR